MTKRLDEYFGLLSMYGDRLRQMVDHANRIDLSAHVAANAERDLEQHRQTATKGFDNRGFAAPMPKERVAALEASYPSKSRWDYAVTDEGVAILDVYGSMMKQSSSFGGSSTVSVRQQLREIRNNNRIGGALIRWDTPGGTVAGTDDLAHDIAALAAAKPVHSYAEDMCASAGYYAACQATEFYSNASAVVGSIGVFAVVVDYSKMADDEGLKVHVVKRGDLKGAFAPGTEITDDQLAALQRRVDSAYDQFVAAVASGRAMAVQTVLETIANGDVWVGAEAVKLGLIDGVRTWDQAVEGITAATQQANGTGTTPRRTVAAEPTESPVATVAATTTEPEAGAKPMPGATHTQLKAALPNASADFILAQLDKADGHETAESHISAARADYIADLEKASEEQATERERLEAERRALDDKKAATPKVPSGADPDADDSSAGDPIAEFESALEANVKKFDGDRSRAMTATVLADEGRHQRYLQAYNDTPADERRTFATL